MKQIKNGPDAATGSTTAMNKLVQSFNEMMKEKVRKDFEGHIASTEEAGIYDEELDYVCCSFDYGFDYEYEWREFAWEQDKVQPSVAVEFYRDNGEMFIDMDAMYEYVEKLADEYGVGLDDHCGGQCLICVENPYYVSSVDMKEIDLFENVNNGQFVILADCIDGQVLISEDDKFGFDDLDHAVFIRDEHRFGGVEVDVYFVQKGIDEYGAVRNELIKCIA